MKDTLSDQVRALWRGALMAPQGYSDEDLVVVAAEGHQAAPPGWVGVVTILSQTAVAAPTHLAAQVRSLLEAADRDRFGDTAYVASLLSPSETLGPALLFYGTSHEPAPSAVLGPLELTDVRVAAVLLDATDDERDESGISHTTSGVYVALDDSGVAAAVSGWRVWPHRFAHVSVLTAAGHRGHGHGRAASLAVLNAATRAGLVPQWRAAVWNTGSIGLARRLGLRELGTQFSLAIR